MRQVADLFFIRKAETESNALEMARPDSIDAGLESTRIGYNNSTFEPVGAATAAKQKLLIPYWQWHKASLKVDNIKFAQELSARFGSRATLAY
jgi:hypothetical protein